MTLRCSRQEQYAWKIKDVVASSYVCETKRKTKWKEITFSLISFSFFYFWVGNMKWRKKKNTNNVSLAESTIKLIMTCHFHVVVVIVVKNFWTPSLYEIGCVVVFVHSASFLQKFFLDRLHQKKTLSLSTSELGLKSNFIKEQRQHTIWWNENDIKDRIMEVQKVSFTPSQRYSLFFRKTFQLSFYKRKKFTGK